MRKSQKRSKRSLPNKFGDFIFLYVLGGIGKVLERFIPEDAEAPSEAPPRPPAQPDQPDQPLP